MKNKAIDYGIFFVVFSLIIFGMIMISSVSVYPSFKVTSLMAAAGKIDEPHNHFYLVRNISHVIIGLFLFAFVVKTPYAVFEKYAKHFFL
jgi:cell division protein FtsW (lipid II flippase)